MDWVPRERDYAAEAEERALVLEEADDHPLNPDAEVEEVKKAAPIRAANAVP